MQNFNKMITSKLDYYVYALADPRVIGSLRDQVFYVGKGKDNRCFNHASEKRAFGDGPLLENEHKLHAIREIRKSSKEVMIYIVKHGLTEDEAFTIEAVLIPLLGSTNKDDGYGAHELWLTQKQITERYDNPIQRKTVREFRCNILIVSLNKQDTDHLLKEDISMAKATLGDWNVGEKNSQKIDYIVGVKHGLVVSIFEMIKDDNNNAKFERFPALTKGKHGRSRFTGHRKKEIEEELRGRSILENNVLLTKIRPGAACQYLPSMNL